MSHDDDLTRPNELHQRNSDDVTLVDRAMNALSDHVQIVAAEIEGKADQEDRILERLVSDVLGAEVEAVGRLVVLDHFRLSYRLVDLEPRLFAWWSCSLCGESGDWRRIDDLVDLALVEIVWRNHYARGQCRPWARR
jgi:hypothetical protein